MKHGNVRRMGVRIVPALLGVLVLVASGALPVAARGPAMSGSPAPALMAQGSATERINGATFQFDPGVSELDRYDVIEGIRLGQRAIAAYLGVPTLPNLRVSVLSRANRESDTTLASAYGSEIEVYTGSEVWQLLAPIERVETLVHELTHVYQNMMIGDSFDVEPLWFAEGTADAIGFQSVFPVGVTDQDEVYNLMSYMLTKYPITTPLSELEGYGTMDADAYPLAYMAVQYLLGSRGLSVSAIGEAYDGLAAGRTFTESFESAFGISLVDFYAEFEAWRPAIVQTYELDDDFWSDDARSKPSALTLASMPEQMTMTGQLMVSGQTAPHVSCELGMVIGSTAISRPAESNGAGEVYWLVSMPEGTQPGSGSLTASCGRKPETAGFAVTG